MNTTGDIKIAPTRFRWIELNVMAHKAVFKIGVGFLQKKYKMGVVQFVKRSISSPWQRLAIKWRTHGVELSWISHSKVPKTLEAKTHTIEFC